MPIELIQLAPELAEALVAAYGELPNPKKDADNPFFHSTYATLAACRNATVPILAKHGLFLMQDLKTATLPDADGGVSLASECWTMIVHKSGHGVRLGPFTLPAGQNTSQALASAATYARRYSANGATNIAPDDDDDGNEATKRPDPASAANSEQHTSGPRRAPHERPVAPASNGLPARPVGVFGYGRKFVDTPWIVMSRDQLEWFRDAERVPPAVRDKCRAELAWREYETDQLDAARALQQETLAKEVTAGLDDKIPF